MYIHATILSPPSKLISGNITYLNLELLAEFTFLIDSIFLEFLGNGLRVMLLHSEAMIKVA